MGEPDRKRALLTRRMFLRGTLGGVVVLAVGGLVAGRWRSRVTRKPRRPLRFFTGAEFSVMTAVAEAMLPVDEKHADFGELDTVERIDEFLAGLPKHETKDLKSLLFAVENLPPVLGPKLGFFTALGDGDRRAYLRGWERSRFAFKRTGFAALKHLTMIHYWADRRAWKAIGYVPLELAQWSQA